MQLICLVYSLTGRASPLILPVDEKISNLDLATNVSHTVKFYGDNSASASMLFILGFS